MEKFILFGILSVPSVYFSWRALFSVKSHGFYRFFGWEGLIWLFTSNYTFWFHEPFSASQIISWILLLISAYLAFAGFFIMRKQEKSAALRDDKTLFHFEKTTVLIKSCVFRYIRHPLYGSLIYLTWGICLKNPLLANVGVALLSTILFYITSRYDEKECTAYFGEEYKNYMKKNRMFIPFVF